MAARAECELQNTCGEAEKNIPAELLSHTVVKTKQLKVSNSPSE
jgi:hypothetical protein